MNPPLKTVALLARRPGLNVLTEALSGNSNIDLISVFTHSKLPKADGGGARPEFSDYEEVCQRLGVPLQPLDYPEAKNLDDYLPNEAIDLLVALSWRFVVLPKTLERLRLGSINLHRGALPAYSGAEPVRRAIEAGESRVAITAHQMAEEIDAGPVIASVWMDIEPQPANLDSAGYAEVIKTKLEPLYAPLCQEAIAALMA